MLNAVPQQALAGATTTADLIEVATYLGIQEDERQLHWLAEECMAAPLPAGWVEHTDAEGNSYFHNKPLGLTSWSHPTDAIFQRLVPAARIGFRKHHHSFSLAGGSDCSADDAAASGPRLRLELKEAMRTIEMLSDVTSRQQREKEQARLPARRVDPAGPADDGLELRAPSSKPVGGRTVVGLTAVGLLHTELEGRLAAERRAAAFGETIRRLRRALLTKAEGAMAVDELQTALAYDLSDADFHRLQLTASSAESPAAAHSHRAGQEGGEEDEMYDVQVKIQEAADISAALKVLTLRRWNTRLNGQAPSSRNGTSPRRHHERPEVSSSAGGSGRSMAGSNRPGASRFDCLAGNSAGRGAAVISWTLPSHASSTAMPMAGEFAKDDAEDEIITRSELVVEWQRALEGHLAALHQRQQTLHQRQEASMRERQQHEISIERVRLQAIERVRVHAAGSISRRRRRQDLLVFFQQWCRHWQHCRSIRRETAANSRAAVLCCALEMAVGATRRLQTNAEMKMVLPGMSDPFSCMPLRFSGAFGAFGAFQRVNTWPLCWTAGAGVLAALAGVGEAGPACCAAAGAERKCDEHAAAPTGVFPALASSGGEETSGGERGWAARIAEGRRA